MWSDGPGPVQVSEAAQSGAEHADVAISADGSYVVVWQEEGDIKFRRFSPNSTSLDATPRTWLSRNDGQYPLSYDRPSIAMTDSGSFVVTYEVRSHYNSNISFGSIGFTMFSADGSPVLVSDMADSFRIHPHSTPSKPKIASTNDGRFAIVWQEGIDQEFSVTFDVFDASGRSAPDSFIISSYEDIAPTPDIAMHPITGEITIVNVTGTITGHERNSDIVRRVYQPDRLLLKSEKRIHAGTDGNQYAPSVAMNAAGDVFYAWLDQSHQNGEWFNSVRYGSENIFDLTDDLWPTERTTIMGRTYQASYSTPQIAVSHRRDTVVISWGDSLGIRQINLPSNPDGEWTRYSRGGVSEETAIAMNADGDYVIVYSGSTNVYADPHRFQPFDSIGVFRDGVWSLDLDFDNTYGFGDTSFEFGLAGDSPVVGDWDGDGFANVGVFRDGIFYLDFDGNFHFDQRDLAFAFGLKGDQPVVGDWNGDGRDDIGVFRNGNWFLDANGSYGFEPGTDAVFTFGLAGDTPVVTDLLNDGRPIWGVFRDGVWSYDRNRNGTWEGISPDLTFEFGESNDQVITGNWLSPDVLQRTGIESPAVFRNGTWSLKFREDLHSNDGDADVQFGNSGDEPVRGNFSLLALKNSTTLVRRDEVAVYRSGSWTLDANGNQTFDAFDQSFQFGASGYLPVAGDFDGDGFDEIGVFLDGAWLIDIDGNRNFDPNVDLAFVYGTGGDRPVVGDWDGEGRDEVGIYRFGGWTLDTNHNFIADPDDGVTNYGIDGGLLGYRPVVGDWNGDGRDEIGNFKDGVWRLDYNGNRRIDSTDYSFFYGTVGDQPVVGDWNGDGFDDVGVKRGEVWFLDKNGNDEFDSFDAVFSYGAFNDFALAGRWPISL